MDRSALYALVEGSPDALLLVDQDGVIRYANGRVTTLFGYAADELVGQSIDLLVPESARGGHVAMRRAFAAKPTIRPMGDGRELRARCKNGEERAVDIMLSPAVGALEGSVIATVRDATSRLATQSRLRASETLFKALFDQAPDAIVAVDAEGRIARVNRQTQLLFGYAEEELLGQPIEILIPDRYRGDHVGKRRAFTGRPTSRPMGRGLELTALTKDGQEVPVDILLSPVTLPDEGDLVLSVLRDITDRRLAEQAIAERTEQLVRSNKELELFAYVASHDLQEPLRTVASSCQILGKRLGGKLDEDTAEFLQFAVDGAKRMRDLIDDLLAYSRVTRSEKAEPVPLASSVERARQNLRNAIEDAKAEIVVPARMPTVVGDPGHLALVFQNLIGNGVKFRRPGVTPRVVVAATEETGPAGEATVRVTVADNGIGMDAKYHERIFTIFQRLHSIDQYPGTGIGLAIVKKIVERHGGAIGVQSTVGEGSTFTFTLRRYVDGE